MSSRPAVARGARRWRAALLCLAAALLLSNLWALLHAPRALDAERAGAYLAVLGEREPGGWRLVTGLPPGSPLAAAGVQVGDRLRFDNESDAPGWRALDTQETVPLAWRPQAPAAGAPAERRLAITPVADPEFRVGRAWFSYVAGWSARFIGLALGVLIVLKRPQDAALRGLALALMLSSLFSSYFLPGGGFHDLVDLLVRPVTDLLWAAGLLWFALRYPTEQPPWALRPVRWGFAVLAGSMLFFGALSNAAFWRGESLNTGLLGWLQAGWGNLPLMASQVTLLAAMAWSCWRAQGALRARLLSVTLAMCFLQSGNLLLGLASYTPLWPQVMPWMFAFMDLTWLLGSVLLVWAVLRYRAFDFGVVMQRTLALSVVSTGLLTALGLGKWITERLLHDAGVPRGLWADLLVALVVVAAFALLQKRLITRVDSLVFRRWHEAAEALRAFVDRAALVTEPRLLQQRFVAAVDAFAAAQGAALYSATAAGELRLEQATLQGAPARLDVNDALAIELRHGTRRIDLTRLPDSAATGLGEWAFAMSVRGRVSGMLLLSPRPEGVAYRPEELAQLEDSARRIGLDLESLRVAELEQSHKALRRELQALQHPRGQADEA